MTKVSNHDGMDQAYIDEVAAGLAWDRADDGATVSQLLEKYGHRIGNKLAILRMWNERPDQPEVDQESAKRHRIAARQSSRLAAINSVGVHKRARDVLLSPHKTMAMAAVRKWHRSGKWALLLCSNVGVGKTVAAAYGAFLAGGCRWLSAPRFAAMSMYDMGPWDEMLASNLIVLDDLGKEYADQKGAMQVRLDMLVDERYSEIRPLIISTNFTAELFSERYGERIVSRLRDGGTVVELGGKDLRGAK